MTNGCYITMTSLTYSSDLDQSEDGRAGRDALTLSLHQHQLYQVDQGAVRTQMFLECMTSCGVLIIMCA